MTMTINNDCLVEISGVHLLYAVVFSPDGEYLVSGASEGVRMWRVEDGEELAAMEARNVVCVAVSKDGSKIAAGTGGGDVLVWNAETHQQLFKHEQDNGTVIQGVDFSPDATRLVVASLDRTASVWDLATGERVSSLLHDGWVIAARYSPHGDKIATATYDSVRVYDSNNGHLLLNVKVTVMPWHNKGLLWFDTHFLVTSSKQIKQIDAFTGSTVSEWPVPETSSNSCIALPNHGKFIAHTTNGPVTLWNISTSTQLGLVQHPQHIQSIAVSPDDRFLAVGGYHGSIRIVSLSGINEDVFKLSSGPCIADSFLLSLHPTLEEPDLHIDNAALDLWEQDQLINTETFLTTAIAACPDTTHHIHASRALLRGRLGKWDAALTDAEKDIKIQPSVIGYIAMSIALIGKGERQKGYRTCDVALAHSHPSRVSFLLIIKAIIVFMAGEHRDAISRIDDLISTLTSNSICCLVQAYMYLLLGNSLMEHNDYEGAIKSFEHARGKVRHNKSQLLVMISLIFGWQFDNMNIAIQRCMCDALYATGRIRDAVECFREMTNSLGGETNLGSGHLEWARNFKQGSVERLEHLGDVSADAQRHDEAISYYTAVLSLSLPSLQGILIKRGRVFLAAGLWQQALDDANQVIHFDPSSPWGYQMKHGALHGMGEYDDAIDAFEAMFSKIVQSPDPDVQQHNDQYIDPSTTRAAIRRAIQRNLRHSPRVLIHTTTGRLHDRTQQVSAFESLPIFNKLVSSMTRRVDYACIKREVRQFFRYVMLSHRWEDDEPLFQQVLHTAVYDLDKSSTHDKLQMFCKIVRDGGFVWAWSDTCCIDKSDHFVLQEALVAMFKWYQGSALVFVFLRGVCSASQLGALAKSVWNTRAWTLQEYIAAKVVRFYTEDWTLYLDLELPNHKESLEVISEMEQATGVSAEQLMSLRPGLTSIREKLCLASIRHTALVEDAAYSLLGIFSVTGLPAIYGEGEGSLGRLLAHVLTGSGDASILAWTGESGSFNSCLPAQITVFTETAKSHLPSPIPDAEMETVVALSSLDIDVALRVYHRLSELPPPWFVAGRMKLPCIAFKLPTLSPYRTRSGRLYRADTPVLGRVEITTGQDLSRMKSLYLVHPWLDALLEPEDLQNEAVVEYDPLPPSANSDDGETSDEELDEMSSPVPEPELRPHAAPGEMAPMDEETRARRFVARLRQPFGALLLTPVTSGRRGTDYRRVAADGLIRVRFQEGLSLVDILDNVKTLDVL